jgi:hypothetical protein
LFKSSKSLIRLPSGKQSIIPSWTPKSTYLPLSLLISSKRWFSKRYINVPFSTLIGSGSPKRKVVRPLARVPANTRD